MSSRTSPAGLLVTLQTTVGRDAERLSRLVAHRGFIAVGGGENGGRVLGFCSLVLDSPELICCRGVSHRRAGSPRWSVRRGGVR
ncbi:hypothetical protein [Streptomyces sp. CL12]|uniref:hypothetical protein n=1 Tax=Streptomyces sp. CL12 TaxID=3391744 RepID=UPI003A80431C